MTIRKRIVAAAVVAMTMVATMAHAQQTQAAGFLSGPLSWTPVLQLREAGVDSNVFNAPAGESQDVTGGLGAAVDGSLKVPAFQLAMHGSSEYQYFNRYKSQGGLNTNVSLRGTLPWTHFQPSVYGTFLHAKDRSSNEFDVRAPHADRKVGAGVTTNIGQRFSVILDANRTYIEYSKGSQFAGEDIAERLNRRSSYASSALSVVLTPFTAIRLEGGYGLDEFTDRPEANTKNLRTNIGFSFSPDAVISGSAAVGYHKMYPEHVQTTSGGAQEFSGVTAAVDASYLMFGVTRFGVTFTRDTTYSVSPTASYYLTTGGGLNITQTLPGPFMLNVHGTRQQLAYPASAAAAAHSDAVDLVGGGLQISVSDNAVVSLIYDYTQRRSVDALFDYDRRRIFTTVTYGF